MDNAQIKTIEKLIGCGQVEELVQQAKDELSLIEDYYRGRLLGELTCRIQNLGRTEGRESLSVTKWYLLSFFLLKQTVQWEAFSTSLSFCCKFNSSFRNCVMSAKA